MHINLKKFVALATAGYLILGTTACKNKTIKTEEEIVQDNLSHELQTDGCTITGNDTIFLSKEQSDEWYKKLNEYIKGLNFIKLETEQENYFDLTKINLSNITSLSLDGNFDITKLKNIDNLEYLSITSDCINIDKVPRLKDLIIRKTKECNIKDILTIIDSNGNTPESLYLKSFNIDYIPIKTNNLIITYEDEVPEQITVDTKDLVLENNSNHQQPQQNTTEYKNLPVINGSYNRLVVYNFNVDYDKIINKSNLSFNCSNINTSIEEIIENKNELYKTTLNENTIEYYSNDHNFEQTRSYYKISKEERNKLAEQMSEIDFLEQLFSSKYEIENVDITEKVYVKTNNSNNSSRI